MGDCGEDARPQDGGVGAFAVRFRTQTRRRDEGKAASRTRRAVKERLARVGREHPRRQAESHFARIAAASRRRERVRRRPRRGSGRKRPGVGLAIARQHDARVQIAFFDCAFDAAQQLRIEGGERDDGDSAGAAHERRIVRRAGRILLMRRTG